MTTQETRLLPAAHVAYVEELTHSAENGKKDTETVAVGDRFWLADENRGGTVEVEDLPARAQVELIKRLINLGGRELGLGHGVFDRLLGIAGVELEPEPPQPKPSSAEMMASVGPQLFEVHPVPDLSRSIAEAARKPGVQRVLAGMDVYGLDTAFRVHK